MTLDELVDLMAQQPNASLLVAVEADPKTKAVRIIVSAAACPTKMRPVSQEVLVDPRTAASRGASRHLRQLAGEVGCAVRRQVERRSASGRVAP